MAFIGQTISSVGAPDLVIPNVPCDPSVLIGNWVRMNSSNIAINALADNLSDSNILGLVESKAGTTKCNVRVLGVSSALFTGLDVTREYYLSSVDPGKMDLVVPTNPGEVVLKVGQPYSDTQFLVLKGIRTVRA